MELPTRKPNRLKGYDYATFGAYFITVCTVERECLFWADNVGERIALPIPQGYELSEYGKIVASAIDDIPCHYPCIEVDKYVIMPNHVHMILTIQEDGRAMRAPTISTVINQMKGYVTKNVGFPIWQKSFYDHIIRNEKEYEMIWEYIHNNPALWLEGKDECGKEA